MSPVQLIAMSIERKRLDRLRRSVGMTGLELPDEPRSHGGWVLFLSIVLCGLIGALAQVIQ